MTKNIRRWTRAATAICLGAVVGTAAAAEPRLEHDWYRIELILFERGELDESLGNEKLEFDRPRQLPRNAVAFDLDDAARRQFFRLGAEQIEALRLPAPRPEFATVLSDVFSGLDDVPVEVGLGEPALDGGVDADPAEPRRADFAPIRVAPELPVLTVTERALRARADAVRAYEADLLDTAYRLLPEGEHTLVREAARLRTNRGFDVVFHGAWHQPVPPRNAPLPVLFQAGPRIGDQWRYEGTLAVTLGRFLHLHVDLWRESEASDQNGLLPRGAFETYGLPRLATGRYEKLDEHRRMRSTEVHYLDHPRFGLLVRIDPVTLPEHLTKLETFLDRVDTPAEASPRSDLQ